MNLSTIQKTKFGNGEVFTEAIVLTKGKEFFKENRRISIQNLVQNQTNWIDIKAERRAERISKRKTKKAVYSY
jgi:hypothetical protein